MLAPSACPANGDLHDAAAFDAMLQARASSRRELLIFVLGWTNGKSQIAMRDEGVHFIDTQISSLRRHGVGNYLVLTPQLGQPGRKGGTDNMCLTKLRPRGVCCAFSSIGMRELSVNRGNASWGMFSTHPYMLFLQRWWFTTQALTRGYSILSLDSDLQLSTNPFEVVHAPAFASFDVLFQGDGGWPVRQRRAPALERSRAGGGGRKRDASLTHRDGDEVGVTCAARTAHHAPPEGQPCPCDVTAAPSLNTGFVFARASAGARAAALFNATVQTILRRLTSPAVRDSRGVIHQGRLWPQAVMNEMVFDRAALPAAWAAHGRAHAAKHEGRHEGKHESKHEGKREVRSAGCHPHDVDCQPYVVPKVPDPLGVLVPRAWWVHTPRVHSVWLASEARQMAGRSCVSSLSDGDATTDGDEATNGRGGAQGGVQGGGVEASGTIRPLLDHLIAHTDVATVEGTAPLRVAVLPRPAVGRLCGVRARLRSRARALHGPARPLPQAPSLPAAERAPCRASSSQVRKIALASLHGVQSAPLPCSAYSQPSFLGMRVQHLQFMSMFTRMHVFNALHWFDSRNGSMAAVAEDGARVDARVCPATPAALESILPATARVAVLIGTAVANYSIVCASRVPAPFHGQPAQCPCCWLAPEALAKETTGCPTWNPNI